MNTSIVFPFIRLIIVSCLAISGCSVSPPSNPLRSETGSITDQITDQESTPPLAVSALASFAVAFPLTPDGGLWIDLPSYRFGPLDEIRFLYRMTFNPAHWQLTKGESIKDPAYFLSSRVFAACRIFPTVGKGYGPGVIAIREMHEFSGVNFMQTTLIGAGGSSSTVICGGPDDYHTCYAVVGGIGPNDCHDSGLGVIRSIQLIENPRWNH